MSSVSSHVARALAQHVVQVFGVMGNGNAWFLDAVHRDTTGTYVAMRHEAGAVTAADAYFRASGRLAIAATTYGRGFTNTLTALAEATGSSPSGSRCRGSSDDGPAQAWRGVPVAGTGRSAAAPAPATEPWD